MITSIQQFMQFTWIEIFVTSHSFYQKGRFHEVDSSFNFRCLHCKFVPSFSLEERQRAEKRNREAKEHNFTPRWFDLTDEVTPTPWGDLELYQYNGKYTHHRAAVDNSDSVNEVDVKSTEFNPWQYGNLSAKWGTLILCLLVEFCS